MRPALALLLLAVLALSQQMAAPAWRGTEGRRVAIAQEMLHSGDFILPTFGHEPTLAKPPLYYWVLAGTQALVGTGMWAMRMPSLVAMWLFAVYAFFTLAKIYGRASAWVVGVGILASPVVLYHTPFAEIDPLFSALTAGSILALGRALVHGGRLGLILAGTLGGMALLTKGPPYLMFLTGALLVWGRHRRLQGIGWFSLPLLLIPVSYYLVLLAGDTGFDRLYEIASSESVGRITGLRWRHLSGTPLYLLRAAAITLPLGFWVFSEFRGSHSAQLEKGDLISRLCAGSAIGGVLILACFPGRSVRYILPGSLMLFCALAPRAAAFARSPTALLGRHLAVVHGIGIIGAVGLLILPWLPLPLPGRSPWLAGCMALTPVLVRNRFSMLVAVLSLPVVFAWTSLVDRDLRFSQGPRAPREAARLLIRDLSARQATDLATYGHFSRSILLHAGLDLPGDEDRRRQPEKKWILLEDKGRPLPEPEQLLSGYRQRTRIMHRSTCLVLMQRRGP